MLFISNRWSNWPSNDKIFFRKTNINNTFFLKGTTLDNSPMRMSVKTLLSWASSIIKTEYFINKKSCNEEKEIFSIFFLKWNKIKFNDIIQFNRRKTVRSYHYESILASCMQDEISSLLFPSPLVKHHQSWTWFLLNLGLRKIMIFWPALQFHW